MMLTVPDVSRKIGELFGCAPIKQEPVRRAFDDLGLLGKLKVERVGNGTRLIEESESNLSVIAERLRETGALASAS